jgi:hypothetical protein
LPTYFIKNYKVENLRRVHIWKSEAKPVVSRRKILESLEEGDAEDDEDEEQRTTKSSENSYDDEDGNDDDDRVFFSSSGDELSESGSFAGGGGEERFSRSFFLRSLPDGAGSQSRWAIWALTPPPSPFPPIPLLSPICIRIRKSTGAPTTAVGSLPAQAVCWWTAVVSHMHLFSPPPPFTPSPPPPTGIRSVSSVLA